ncbi:uncharacterized protein LOC114942073 [Nylanderia fulva]|nr:uncharacterized protein LOC114942073 [Nylanderia fulva]
MCQIVSDTGMYNVEQDVRLANKLDSRSIEDVSMESVDFKTSDELFPDMTYSNIKTMQCLESNTCMYVEQDIRLFDDNEKLIDSRSVEDTSESVDLNKSEELFPDTTDSNIKTMQCLESNTCMYVEQDIRLFDDNEKLIDSRSVEDTSESVESEELFPDTTDSKIQSMLYQKSNTAMYSVKQNVKLGIDKCFESMYIDDSNDSKSMHYDKSIDFEKSVESFTDTMDSNIQVMRCLESNTDICNVENGVEDDKYYVIEKIKKSSIDKDDIKENLPAGRRIMDFSFIWTELHRIFDRHNKALDCSSIENLLLIKSEKCGLKTQLFFQCKMCKTKASIWSEPTKPEIMDINTAAVAGTLTVGTGYAQLEKQLAVMNVPSMSEPMYIKSRDKLVDEFVNTSIENMKTAGEIEKKIALDNNEVINGIPYITVVADGSWMKRSYGTTYDSPAGIGAIIGYRTRKVLYVGVKNKYCIICDMAERRGIEPKTHNCYKNFDRNVSSTKMESDAIAEGFNCSLEMHGLIFKTLVADGDSSVYQSIKNNNPYGEHMITVTKIECTNHLLRNLCKKIKTVAEKTRPKTSRRPGLIQVRNVIKNKILEIRKEITEAAALRRQERQPQHRQAMELQTDILNIPRHVFGDHKQCKERGKETCDGEENYIDSLKSHGLYLEIEEAVEYISGYSDSLLLNYTNNITESFNSSICAQIGGKRILVNKKGGYNARVAGAVLQFNTQQVITEVHKSMNKTVPPIVEKLEKRRREKLEKNKEYRQIEGRSKKFKQKSGTDSYYGPHSQKPDLPSDVIEQFRQNHFKKLSENAKNWQKIERDTTKQNESQQWLQLRRKMLTASNFGTVCCKRMKTSCALPVKNILYPSAIETEAIKYGREKEPIARKELVEILKKRD